MSECVWEIGVVSWVCHLPSSTGGCEQVERLLLKTSARKTSWTIGYPKGTCENSSEACWVQQPGRFHPTGNFHQQTGRFSKWKESGEVTGGHQLVCWSLRFPLAQNPEKSLGIKGIIIYIYTFNTIDNTIRVDFWSCVYHGYHLWSVYHTCRLSHDPMCVIDICMAENLRRTKLNDFSQIKKYLI